MKTLRTQMDVDAPAERVWDALTNSTVLAVDAGRELRWIRHLLVPGLFDGEHRFDIHLLGPGRVRFVQQERFTGVLVPLFARNLDTHTLAGFNAMNATRSN